MNTIDVTATIDVCDVLEELSTEDLKRELRKRNEFEYNEKLTFDFSTPKQQFDIVRQVLGLREFHTKKRVINDLQELAKMF